MRFLGIDLHKPTFQSITIAAALAVTLWLVLLVVVGDTSFGGNAVEAGQVLVAIAWGCICAALGLRFRRVRELAVYAAGCALLIGAYQGVVAQFIA